MLRSWVRSPSSPPGSFRGPPFGGPLFRLRRSDAARGPDGAGHLQSFGMTVRSMPRSFRWPALVRTPLAVSSNFRTSLTPFLAFVRNRFALRTRLYAIPVLINALWALGRGHFAARLGPRGTGTFGTQKTSSGYNVKRSLRTKCTRPSWTPSLNAMKPTGWRASFGLRLFD